MAAGPAPSDAKLKAEIVAGARALGFDACGFARAELPRAAGEALREYVREGRHGTMAWMADTLARRADPRAMWPEARTAIMVAMNYGPDEDPLAVLARKDRAAISVYARHRDYHDVIKGKLKALAGEVARRTGADVKVFVDTAPLMEKPLAQGAGLGWQGKHTNLVSRDLGSWTFLGAVLTTAEIAPDDPHTDHCGACRACLDVCPTAAFPAPYRLDARRCLSYLTIEHAGPIPAEFRAAMGNRVYGCDDCLAVCPWNKFAKEASEAKLRAREDRRAPALADLLRLDDAAFRAAFSGSPVKRIGRDRFVRNALIAAGNSGDAALLAPVRRLLDDPAPVVRGAAVWALSRLARAEPFEAERRERAGREADPSVRLEWATAQSPSNSAVDR